LVSRKRLDVLLVERGFFDSRAKARGAIMAGHVYVDQVKVDKAGKRFGQDVRIEVRGAPGRYVSRGGLKLEKALQTFKVPVQGVVAIDVGASTGGFTDCLLQHGARRVYAVDVGYGQLAWSLRRDPRVTCLERVNIRYMDPALLAEKPTLATVDVAFISLEKVLPSTRRLLADKASILALVKPQFEAGREQVGRKGVVRSAGVHQEVLGKVARTARKQGFQVVGMDFSPVKGPEGNVEFWLYLRCGEVPELLSLGEGQIEEVARTVVEAAHQHLEEK